MTLSYFCPDAEEDLSVRLPELVGPDVPIDSVDADFYSLVCPQCDDVDSGLSVLAVRIVPHGRDGRPSAQVACMCDSGCVTSFVIGAASPGGYAFWTRDVAWAIPVIPGRDPAEHLALSVDDPYEDIPEPYPVPDLLPDDPRPDVGYADAAPVRVSPLLIANLDRPVLWPLEQSQILRAIGL